MTSLLICRQKCQIWSCADRNCTWGCDTPPHPPVGTGRVVGDDAFPMSVNLMKPYPQRNLEPQKRIFNYRLSRARRVVENAFSILAHRWRVFLTTVNMCPDKLTYVILPLAVWTTTWQKEINQHMHQLQM